MFFTKRVGLPKIYDKLSGHKKYDTFEIYKALPG